MVSLNNSLVFKLAILVAIIAFVCCTNDRTHQVYKKKVNRGIILKCQGNPISCYGKRSQPVEDSEQQSSSSSDEIESSADAILQEYKYEKQLEILIRNCKLGIDKACNIMLDIMLMNSN